MPLDKWNAHKLIHDGVQAFAEVEAAGIRIDADYLDQAIQDCNNRIKKNTTELKRSEVYELWQEKYGNNIKLGNRKQLGDILFNDLGYESHKTTPSGRPKTDEEALSKVDDPFVKLYLKTEKLKKLKNTYLKGVRQEVVDGRIHPFFNLHSVRTFRSSSDSPNFTNIPIRDPEAGATIRKAFIPSSKDHVLLEVDYKAIEVRVAACYCKDPVLIEYIEDPEKDMHRDMAAECFMCSTVDKLMRYVAKNRFVFPEFYGSYFLQIAPNLWDAIREYGMKIGDEPLKQFLKRKGIKKLGNAHKRKGDAVSGTFEYHIKEVEHNFWNNRFKVYNAWREDWYAAYCKKGWFQMLTGFVCQGIHGRNDVINYPVQGAAFHCLLWSLIQVVRELKKRKMKSKVVGLIHDSLVADVLKSEQDAFIEIVKRVMTVDLPKAWKWIIVPLEIEVEIAESNWFEKQPLEI